MSGRSSGLEMARAKMADAGVDFTRHVYSGARHAFFNDSNAVTYDPDAAADAWQRTLDFLNTSLQSSPPMSSASS